MRSIPLPHKTTFHNQIKKLFLHFHIHKLNERKLLPKFIDAKLFSSLLSSFVYSFKKVTADENFF